MNQPAPSVSEQAAGARAVAADALSALAVALGIAATILLVVMVAVWLPTLPRAGEPKGWGHLPAGYLAALLPLAGAAVTLAVRADMIRDNQ